MLDKIIKGKQTKPRRTLLYGCHGVGKSTWAAQWPFPIVVPTEDGVGDIDCDKYPVCQTSTEAMLAVKELAGVAEHDYQTLILDSADWLERLIWRDLCEAEGKKSIADFGYGSGYVKAAQRFERVLQEMDRARNNPTRPMHIVILAHSSIVKFESPDGQSYDRYQPKLHKETSAMLQEWADEVLFACYEISTVNQDEGFGKKRAVPLGTAKRIIRTAERPTAIAKNRLRLPETMDLDFGAYAPYLKGAK